ncbi:GDSL-type esterase/lipase family protein [Nocardia amamiensis]|uniref:GDSL-type esterase/lipase family protein n=1 Tax=Nocardia amamiensis TaxID=404578 RepID=UPI0033DDE0A0
MGRPCRRRAHRGASRPRLLEHRPDRRHLRPGHHRTAAIRARIPAELVHLSCGGNDLFLPGGDIADLRENLDTLFGTLARTGAQVVTFTLADVWEIERMAPMRPMRDRMAALNDLIRELAARYDALLLELWDHPLRLRPDLMSADLIHFSMSGHAVLASDMVRTLADHIPAPR